MSNLLTIIAIPVVIIMFLLICVALALLNKLSGSISMLLSLQGQDSAKYDQSIQSLFSQLDLQHSSISDIETNLMKAIESTKQEIIAKDERNGAYYTDIIHTVQATNQYMHQLLPLAELKPQIEAILTIDISNFVYCSKVGLFLINVLLFFIVIGSNHHQ